MVSAAVRQRSRDGANSFNCASLGRSHPTGVSRERSDLNLKKNGGLGRRAIDNIAPLEGGC